MQIYFACVMNKKMLITLMKKVAEFFGSSEFIPIFTVLNYSTGR